MKYLHPIKGRHYIEELIAQGEHQQQDFKFLISDARKIARSISAFANHCGGRLLIGVKDNGAMAGVRNEEDIYVVEQAARLYCRPAQDVEFTAFNVGQGVVVIRASISTAERRPVFACDTDGRWKAFFRVADENIVAHPLMIKAWQMRENAEENLIFTLSEAESRLLDTLDDGPTALVARDIAVRLHLPESEIERLIVRLGSLGIIVFEYNGNGVFHIRRAD